MMKRADVLLVEKGFINSRERSKRVILEGVVYIDGRRVNKPSESFLDDSEIDIRVNPLVYVSRAGLKLQKAIREFNLNLNNIPAVDIGSSTGGFTECMLEEGARKVYAIDVGKNQLVEKLRMDPRVIVMEGTNIRDLSKEDIDEEIEFISIDVSFISLKLVLPIANEFLIEDGEIVALIKPQFEVGREKIGKKGIVKDKKLHKRVLESMVEFSTSLGFEVKNLTFSPIRGSKGNLEFLIYLKKNNKKTFIQKDLIDKVLDKAHMSLD